MWEFLKSRKDELLYNTFQHAYVVVLALVMATVIAVLLALVVVRVRRLEPIANAVSAIGLTIPSFAMIGILLPIAGFGPTTALIAITFYAVLPILRNAVVGLQRVDAHLLESARGMGMSELATTWRVRLPLAWPVILAGIRVSAQMSMGVAAIAAYVLGPGLGVAIFTGLTQIGGKNAVNYALSGSVLIVIIALILDGLLLLLGRATISKGIRARHA